VAQGVGPEFKLQYLKRKRSIKRTKKYIQQKENEKIFFSSHMLLP
jgi:hypothetical protein